MADHYKATKERDDMAYASIRGQKGHNISRLARDLDVPMQCIASELASTVGNLVRLAINQARPYVRHKNT